MEKIIELNGIDINSFLGPQDQNIKLIEDAFSDADKNFHEAANFSSKINKKFK